jgi:ribA/ribD-fused uncharacterized protein
VATSARFVIPEFKGEHYFLSNFFLHTQTFTTADQPLKMPSAEHVFQACKYKAMNVSEDEKIAYVVKMAGQKTPTDARKLGKTVKGLDIAAWDEMKIPVMREVLLNKFADPTLEHLLKGTGDAMLVEGNTWGDTFWGRSDKKGYNMLGVILMEIRGYYRLCNNAWPVMQKDIDLPPY